ncbi:MAG: Spy/CpxP family protein refolding chaperone [Bacteroidota bacterium]
MQKIISLVGGIIMNCFAQQLPYVEEPIRPIRSLSEKEIEDYLAGAGMGLAKAAELNHYPGPRHVLDLAAELQLTVDQISKTQQVFDAMKKEAIRLGIMIVNEERALDQIFADQKAEKQAIVSSTTRIARLAGKLRAEHLAAHLAMKDILKPEQIRKYDELRGYASQEHDEAQQPLHKH